MSFIDWLPNFDAGEPAEPDQADYIYQDEPPQSTQESGPVFSVRDTAEAFLKRITNYDIYEVLTGGDEDYSSPNVYTQPKGVFQDFREKVTGKVSDAKSAVSGAFLKYGLMIVAIIFILIVAYGTTLYAIRKKVF
jgi:hypothetical protein